MIDIHTHILPKIDDGSESLKESVLLVKSESEQGVHTIVMTPHLNKGPYKTTVEDVEKSYYFLQKGLDKLHINTKIMLGHEVNVTHDYFDIIKNKSFYTLANTSYILIEFNRQNVNYGILNTIYETKILGYNPVLAHLEYYDVLYDNKDLLKAIIDEGAYIQLNASNVLSKNSTRVGSFCKSLLKENLVSFIASDTHNLTTRPPRMKECYKKVLDEYGEDYANELFEKNAEKLLNNQKIEYKKYPKHKKFWRFKK